MTPDDQRMTQDDEPFTVSDDLLDAMLLARADRVAPGAAARVRERVQGELGERRSGGILAFLPIGDRAGSMRGWAGWGAAIAAAVLVMAVLGGRPTADPGTTAAPSGPSASPDPSASLQAEPGETVQRLDLDAFVLAIVDGSLDGRTVLVNGTLNRGNIACTEPRCDPYWFTGLGSIPVVWTGPAPQLEQAYPAESSFPGAEDWWSGPFLVRPDDGRLELLGRLAGVLENPISVQVALNDPRGYPNASSPFDILPVDGYLVGCPRLANCPTAGNRLMDALPRGRELPEGEGPVTLLDPAPELDASGVASGPFLVSFVRPAWDCPRLAQCMHPGWGINPTVISQYQSDAIIRVDLPDQEGAAPTPSPEPSLSPVPSPSR